MPAEAFSDLWAQEWRETLNSRPAYREAAAGWDGSVALVMTRDGSSNPQRKAVFVDLWQGECREARTATAEDLENARYVLSGTARSWHAVLTGRLAPLMAIMGGKLRLTRGNLATLVPFAAAAKELLAAATQMETEFPDGWV